jgi:hypothetical protein
MNVRLASAVPGHVCAERRHARNCESGDHLIVRCFDGIRLRRIESSVRDARATIRVVEATTATSNGSSGCSRPSSIVQQILLSHVRRVRSKKSQSACGGAHGVQSWMTFYSCMRGAHRRERCIIYRRPRVAVVTTIGPPARRREGSNVERTQLRERG